MGYEVGYIVEWNSGASGYKKTKRGTVLVVVPPKIPPTQFLHKKERNENYTLYQMYDIRPMDGAAYCRNHESYLVRVDQPGNRKPKLYWPRVSLLKRVIV